MQILNVLLGLFTNIKNGAIGLGLIEFISMAALIYIAYNLVEIKNILKKNNNKNL